MEVPRALILVFLLILIFASPNVRPPSPPQQRHLYELIVEERAALQLLNTSQYGDFEPLKNRWINVTGLRQEDEYAWDVLPKVQYRVRDMLWEALRESGYAKLGDLRRLSPAFEHLNESSVNALRDASNPIYHNLTGFVRGQWVRSRIGEGISHTAPNLTALAPHLSYGSQQYDRNISGHDGDLSLMLNEKEGDTWVTEEGSVREMKAQMTIKDEQSSGDGWDMTLHGVHFPHMGGAVLSTTGERFAGIFALPHFMLSSQTFALAQNLLSRTLAKEVAEQESKINTDLSYPWSSSPNKPVDLSFLVPHCEYIIYLQHQPIERSLDVTWTESELRFPTGGPLISPPPLHISALIFSPDCGFVLESKGPPSFSSQDYNHLRGPKLEFYLRLVRHWVSIFACVLSLELALLLRQMKDASTPSTRSRISFYTIMMISMGDGFAFMSFSFASMVVSSAFPPLIAVAFLAALSVSFFGMKLLMDIWTAQAPERQERARQAAISTRTPGPTPAPPTDPNPTVIITPAGADILPLPASARRVADGRATPVILPPDQDTAAAEIEDATATTATQPRQTTFGSLWARFYVFLLCMSLISLHATSWPTTIRSVYTNLLAFCYLSLWIPQLHRNVVRNCRKALRWEFVVGQSVLRLTPFIYFYMVEDNVLFVKTDQTAAFIFAGWVWIQIWALFSQEILGPRFFVPIGWAPPAYDYHPILREGDIEAGANMPIGFTQYTATDVSAATNQGESKENGKKTWDCAICMHIIEAPVASVGNDGEASTTLNTNLLSRRTYMVTPCRHIFHSVCLENWMRYRLQCPICREDLPPI